jgi:hypothetical protein
MPAGAQVRGCAQQAEPRDCSHQGDQRAAHRPGPSDRRSKSRAAGRDRLPAGGSCGPDRQSRRSASVSNRRSFRPASRDSTDPCQLRTTNHHRLHRGGNRQLNKTLLVIAITRARIDVETSAYLDRKRAEGKSSRQALRCLKRYLARRIWKLLFDPPPSPVALLPPARATVSVGARGLKPCAG